PALHTLAKSDATHAHRLSIAYTTQIVGEFGGRLVAVARLKFETLHANRIEVARNFWIQRARRLDAPGNGAPQHVVGFAFAMRRLAGQAQIQNRAERVNVGRTREAVLLDQDLLWRHERGRAGNFLRIDAALVVHMSGQTE